MALKLLVVDDEERLLSLLESYFTQEGFQVLTAADGREALEVAGREAPELIILDLMMPEMDGFEFMRAHRKTHSTPIIMLTAKVEDDDKIVGLELGADDYVTKPFRPRELLARVRAVLRRSGMSDPSAQVLRWGELVLDRGAHTLMLGQVYIDLTPSESELLAALLSAPGRVFSRLELLDRIQGTSYEGYERTIDVHVKNLRAKIEPDPRKPKFIETVYGVGYRLSREK
jgi:DNA-binding response OmpR family regulator